MHFIRVLFFLGILFFQQPLLAQETGEATGNLGTSVSSTESNSVGGGGFSLSGAHLRLKTIDHSLMLDIEVEKKKYLTHVYEEAYVDDYETKVHLRYNIYQDEIEFINQKNIYYLAKEVGRKVHFIHLKSTYKVFYVDDKHQYFKVYVDGETSLLAKHRIRYFEAKHPGSSYENPKPPKFKRLKDDWYIAINNRKMIKISGINKKEFIACFGDRSEIIKSFLNENKLNYKHIEDLKKIVQYYNSL